MDLFNKKKIKSLEDRVKDLSATVLQGEWNKRCIDLEKRVSKQEDMIYELTGILMGLLDYLGVKVDKQWEDDPQFPKPIPRQREVWKIVKRK